MNQFAQYFLGIATAVFSVVALAFWRQSRKLKKAQDENSELRLENLVKDVLDENSHKPLSGLIDDANRRYGPGNH